MRPIYTDNLTSSADTYMPLVLRGNDVTTNTTQLLDESNHSFLYALNFIIGGRMFRTIKDFIDMRYGESKANDHEKVLRFAQESGFTVCNYRNGAIAGKRHCNAVEDSPPVALVPLMDPLY